MKVADYLSELISFPSVTGNKECQTVLDWFQSQVSHLPLNFYHFEDEGHPSLVITAQKTRKPKVLLHSHIDVKDKEVDNQFDPYIENGKLFGRGAYDMKFAAACYLNLLLELGSEVAKYDFGVMLTSDEERGGFHGTGKLVEQGWLPAFCISPDAGIDWNYEGICKGVYQFEVSMKGESGHSSRPWEGDNAIAKLISFIQKLQNEFPVEPCGDKDHSHSTLNIGIISGGTEVNVIAKEAKAVFDIRYTPDTSVVKLKEMIDRITASFSRVSIREIAEAYGFASSPDSIYFPEFYSIAQVMFGIETFSVISHGSSDARFFAEKSVPVLSTRPAGGGLHSACEWIDLVDLNRFYEVIKAFVMKTTLL